MAEDEVGRERFRTMLGVGGAEADDSALRFEVRPEAASGGGGDLRRGEVGHCGGLSPPSTSAGFRDFGGLTRESFARAAEEAFDTLTADSARCTAAADGTEGAVIGVPDRLPCRLGLRSSTLFFRERMALSLVDELECSSILFLRERRPLLVLERVDRAGDDSLEALGDWLAELEIWPGMREEGRLSGAVVGCDEARGAVAGTASGILSARAPPSALFSALPLASLAGSVVSREPVKEPKEGWSRRWEKLSLVLSVVAISARSVALRPTLPQVDRPNAAHPSFTNTGESW